MELVLGKRLAKIAKEIGIANILNKRYKGYVISEKENKLLEEIKEIVDRAYYEETLSEPEIILNSPKEIHTYWNKFLSVKFGSNKKETFSIITLKTSLKLINFHILSTGTTDTAMIYPREVVEKLIEDSGHGIVALHNHPSGQLKPSTDDISITRKLDNILENLGMRLVDHMIITNNGMYSIKEEKVYLNSTLN